MTRQTYFAIRAAKHRNAWGRDATMRYLRNRGVSVKIYQIACSLEG